jgi:CheY-like chemotaxis protein
MPRSATATEGDPNPRSRPHGRTPAERAAHAARAELASRKLDLRGVNVLIVEDDILCDLRMPMIDGYGFIDRLRHDPNLSRSAVRAVTALGSDADVRRTWEAAFDGHLVKPIDYETIPAQLERIFWAHRRRNDPRK